MNDQMMKSDEPSPRGRVDAADAGSRPESNAGPQAPDASPARSTDGHASSAMVKISIFWLFLFGRLVYAVIMGKATPMEGIYGACLTLLVLGGSFWLLRRIARRRS
jgi:hypothetical protein